MATKKFNDVSMAATENSEQLRSRQEIAFIVRSSLILLAILALCYFGLPIFGLTF